LVQVRREVTRRVFVLETNDAFETYRITAIAAFRSSGVRVMRVEEVFSKRSWAMIKKVKGGYKVTSEKGKNLGGPYKSRAAAAKRLRQVEYFKHKG
jgi:hypothetical protein